MNIIAVSSGTGTNLKVGSTSAGSFRSCPSTLLNLQVQLIVLVSAFVMISTVWSVFCLLFFYSRCPPCPAICKSGGTGTRAYGVGSGAWLGPCICTGQAFSLWKVHKKSTDTISLNWILPNLPHWLIQKSLELK